MSHAFSKLFDIFCAQLKIQPYDTVRGWCEQYCGEHWHNEYLNWNVSSFYELFIVLKRSSYHNPINVGLFKFLANKSGDVFLINSMKNYEKEFSCMKIEDLDETITEIGNLSGRKSALIVNTLLENKVTIGQLWNLCTPRCSNAIFTPRTVILDASAPLLEFYNSIKVCSYV